MGRGGAGEGPTIPIPLENVLTPGMKTSRFWNHPGLSPGLHKDNKEMIQIICELSFPFVLCVVQNYVHVCEAFIYLPVRSWCSVMNQFSKH